MPSSSPTCWPGTSASKPTSSIRSPPLHTLPFSNSCVSSPFSDAHVSRWRDSSERCSAIHSWLIRPRPACPLYRHFFDTKTVQAVRLSTIAIRSAGVISIRSSQGSSDVSVLFCTPAGAGAGRPHGRPLPIIAEDGDHRGPRPEARAREDGRPRPGLGVTCHRPSRRPTSSACASAVRK